MAKFHELIVSASDAQVLALMYEQFPADRIAMNSAVTYQEEPHGARRSVVLVHPIEADATAGRISVLSPVGRALLGRTPGSVVAVAVPGTNALTVRVLETTRNRDALAA